MHAANQRSREGHASSPKWGAPVADGHQSLIREVNQRIEELNGEWEQDGRTVVLCECARSECMEKIEISAFAYERIRRSALYFLVKPGHVAEEGERIVEQTHAYVVIETLEPGQGEGELAL